MDTLCSVMLSTAILVLALLLLVFFRGKNDGIRVGFATLGFKVDFESTERFLLCLLLLFLFAALVVGILLNLDLVGLLGLG